MQRAQRPPGLRDACIVGPTFQRPLFVRLLGQNLLPYLSCAIIAAAVSSYFSGPTPAGSSAVNTCPQAPHRHRSSEYTVAASGACPTILTRTFGSFCAYTLPCLHSGQRSPCFRFWCRISTVRAPVHGWARFRPWPAGGGAVASACPFSLVSAPAVSPTTAFV